MQHKHQAYTLFWLTLHCFDCKYSYGKLHINCISAVAGSSLLKDGVKRMKGSTDEIIIGKNHVNPALILHLAKSTKVMLILLS